jgi:hypothetical protein
LGNRNLAMQLNNGEFELNEYGNQFLEKQKRILRFGIPLTFLIAFLLTAGGFYRLSFNLQSILILISTNFINYLLNYRFNFLRRKNLLLNLVTKVIVTDDSISIELVNKENYQIEIERIEIDDPRVLFSEYSKLKEKWSIKLNNEKEAWLIPGFFNEIEKID